MRPATAIPALRDPSRFVAAIEGDVLRALVSGERLRIDGTSTHAPGEIVLAQRTPGGAAVLRRLADPETALAELHHVAAAHGVEVAFPEAVMHEVEAWVAAPRIDDDPRLEDLEAIPFATIDGEGAMDLDQAIHVERVADGGGWIVRYAIADASFYVPRGSALWDEALRRGASYYLPGLAIPMLPRALSEGLVSLNEGVTRRAMVFEMHVDAHGGCTETRLVRARIRSRAKLTWGEVQQLFGAPEQSALSGSELESSLRAMAEVGRARLREARERDVVRYRRREVEVRLEGAAGERFVVLDGVRREVELWSEQISLLCNAEGARLLAESEAPWIQPIFRVHPPPDPERVESLRATIERIVETHALDPARWVWDEGRASLAAYVASLPDEGAHVRVARAIQRQAIMTNVRSTYATSAGVHHGAGFDPYARFSAPMREVVGVYLHAEAIQLQGGPARAESAPDAEAALRDDVVLSANRSKDVQRAITDGVNRRVIDRLFEPELARARPLRRAWQGTVMGISGGKLHVQLDEPGIDVKLYLRDLARLWGGAWLEADELGVVLRERESRRVRARVGDAIRVRIVARDAERDRWVLEALAVGARAADARVAAEEEEAS